MTDLDQLKQDLANVRAQYERCLPLVKAARDWRQAMLGKAKPQKGPAPLVSAGDLLFRAIEKYEGEEQ